MPAGLLDVLQSDVLDIQDRGGLHFAGRQIDAGGGTGTAAVRGAALCRTGKLANWRRAGSPASPRPAIALPGSKRRCMHNLRGAPDNLPEVGYSTIQPKEAYGTAGL